MFNLTEFITKHISIGADKRISEIQLMERELDKWLTSPERQLMIQGERYYHGEHDILQKKRSVIDPGSKQETPLYGLPNNKVVDNQYRKMVNQKKNYLLGKPITITTEDESYLDYIQGVFNKRFMRMLKNLLGDSINGGKAWLFVGYDQAGELSIRKLKPWEIKPFWADAMQKSTLSFTMSNGIIPSEEVVSEIKIAPYLCANAPISRMGFNTPVPVS